MLFNSFDFILFFATVWLVTLQTSRAKSLWGSNMCLLLASYYFYGSFNVLFLIILLYITLVTYLGGICLGRTSHKKSLTGLVILLSLTPLATFKYSAFLLYDVLNFPIGFGGDWVEKLILPVGISFFTFQALTYTLDLYRGKVDKCKNLVDYGLFVAFFPTILSGPIEKARQLLPQIKSLRTITAGDVWIGMRVFIWGLFKKIVIADRLAAYVDYAYSSADYVSGATLALAAVLYSIQIYCDFSGYSDMALGVARCLGFRITNNFKFPYFSTSIKSFWKKWHISLTSWFTEYVYFSLGGNRVRFKAQWIFNISMVFLLSGIWHGASWNFLLWGALHALLYLIEYAMGLQKRGFKFKHWYTKIVAGVVVFACVTLAWIFFRIDSMPEANAVVWKIITEGTLNISMGASAFTFALNGLLLGFFIGCEVMLYRNQTQGECIIGKKTALNVVWTIILLLTLAMCGVTSDHFVYFQF